MTGAILITVIGLIGAVSQASAAKCGYTCSPEDDSLECWRENIDYYSDIILEAVNQRAVVANHIGEWKRQRGLPIVDHSRIGAVLARIASRNPGPLPDSAIVNIFGAIVNETAAYEERFSGKPAVHQCFISSAQNNHGRAELSAAGSPDVHFLLVAILVVQVVLALAIFISLACILQKIRSIRR